jgi:hypothetical protein
MAIPIGASNPFGAPFRLARGCESLPPFSHEFSHTGLVHGSGHYCRYPQLRQFRAAEMSQSGNIVVEKHHSFV